MHFNMKKALQDLIFLGRVEDTFKVMGKDWKMHTLNSSDQLQATASTAEYDNLARVQALKVAILSRALDSIDDEPIGNVGETRAFLNQLQTNIVFTLYEKYEELQEKQTDALTNYEEIKKSPETPSEE